MPDDQVRSRVAEHKGHEEIEDAFLETVMEDRGSDQVVDGHAHENPDQGRERCRRPV